jgi:hypothetical protein
MVADCSARMAVLLAQGSIGLEWYSTNMRALLKSVGW